MRNFLSMLLLAQGVPLLLQGDEFGRTQHGNNNAYCQDNGVTWFDWSAVDDGLLDFTKALLAFRSAHPVFRRRKFLRGVEAGELQWFNTQGLPMSQGDWANESTRCLTIFLDGDDDPDTGVDGRPLVDDDFLLSVNSWKEPVEFVLPAVGGHRSWVTEIDSGEPSDTAHRGDKAIDAGARILIPDFSLLVLRANDQPSGPPSTTTISIPLT
jgi:glycogen operon protein